MTDPIADMLTRIRNAGLANLPESIMPHSQMKEGIARILKDEGYIKGFKVEGNVPKSLKVELKYQGRKPVVEGLKRVSRPGLRRYVSATEIPRVLGGLGIAILSTSGGLISGVEARKRNVGGEVLCYIW